MHMHAHHVCAILFGTLLGCDVSDLELEACSSGSFQICTGADAGAYGRLSRPGMCPQGGILLPGPLLSLFTALPSVTRIGT